MPFSMTAFARVEESHNIGNFVWELRSINHRYLEVNFRLPEELRAVEFDLTLGQSRCGTIDCNFIVRRIDLHELFARAETAAGNEFR